MLVEAPILEPLTVEQGKLRAGLGWAPGDPRDALMLEFIQAARASVERETGIALFTQTHVVPLAAWRTWRYDYPGGYQFDLPWRPVQSVTLETVDATTGAAVPWTAGSWTLDPGSVDPTPARLAIACASGLWGIGLRARIVVGFETVEALQAAAPDLIHAVGLRTAHYATLGRDFASATPLSETPGGYADAIAPYRLVVV